MMNKYVNYGLISIIIWLVVDAIELITACLQAISQDIFQFVWASYLIDLLGFSGPIVLLIFMFNLKNRLSNE